MLTPIAKVPKSIRNRWWKQSNSCPQNRRLVQQCQEKNRLTNAIHSLISDGVIFGEYSQSRGETKTTSPGFRSDSGSACDELCFQQAPCTAALEFELHNRTNPEHVKQGCTNCRGVFGFRVMFSRRGAHSPLPDVLTENYPAIPAQAFQCERVHYRCAHERDSRFPGSCPKCAGLVVIDLLRCADLFQRPLVHHCPRDRQLPTPLCDRELQRRWRI